MFILLLLKSILVMEDTINVYSTPAKEYIRDGRHH